VIELLGYPLLVVGAACALIGAIGIVRLPDVYNRIHANTVVVVGGAILLIIGAGLVGGTAVYIVKALVISAFLFLTNPVSAHAIARAAHKSGVKLWGESVTDKLEEEKPWSQP
jgi:multicomponent Na+:H+ antiporter subunit G